MDEDTPERYIRVVERSGWWEVVERLSRHASREEAIALARTLANEVVMQDAPSKDAGDTPRLATARAADDTTSGMVTVMFTDVPPVRAYLHEAGVISLRYAGGDAEEALAWARGHTEDVHLRVVRDVIELGDLTEVSNVKASVRDVRVSLRDALSGMERAYRAGNRPGSPAGAPEGH